MKYLLVLEAGGVRGFFQLAFLLRLEKLLKRPLNQVFTLVSGTSIGGFLAVMVSENTLTDCLTREKFEKVCNESIWDKVLGVVQTEPKYDGKGKQAMLAAHLKIKTLGETKIPVVVPTFSLSSWRPVVYTSWQHPQINLLTLLDASSAAPLYFPPVLLDSPINEAAETKFSPELHIDGGVPASNPSSLVLLKAKELFPEDRTALKILCLGGGNRPTIDHSKADPSDFGICKWMELGLVSMFINAPVTMVDEILTHYLKERYLKIDNELTGDIPLDDYSKIDLLQAEADRIFEKNEARLKSFFEI